MAEFTIDSLRGGLNDFDPVSMLAPDECSTATNIDFWLNPCGSRRRGSSTIGVTGPSSETLITFLHRHLITNDESGAQLWAWGVTSGVSSTLAYKDTAWHTVSFNGGGIGNDPVINTNDIFRMQGQTAHGRLFLCYASQNGGTPIDRMHVYDGTNLRRAGIAAPNAPVVTNTAAAGTFAGTRYYRCRLATLVGGVTTRRSEPGSTTTFNPSGANTGAIINQPGTSNDGETHWEIEASVDNVNFYRIQQLSLGTVTFTDTQPFTSGYAGIGVLSDVIGNYSLIPSARFVTMDEDRLIFAGSFVTESQKSHIWWTPVFRDPTGVGNDERIPVATNNELDLDGYDGGGITGMSQPLNGVIYVFKFGQIYRLIRTGQVTRAYIPVCIAKTIGAIEGSIMHGVDETGSPCIYFIDPRIGPCRIGKGGEILWAGRYVWNTFQRINLDAAVIARCVFYLDKRQAHWRIAVDGSTTPNLGLVLQTNYSRTDRDGVKRGWSLWAGPSMSVLSMVLFANNVNAGVARSLKLAPFAAISNTIQLLDTGTQDNGADYSAQIVSAPLTKPGSTQLNLQDKFGIRAAFLSVANASSTPQIRLTRNFGEESSAYQTFSTNPGDSRNPYMLYLDNVAISEALAVQVDIADQATPVGQWSINQIMLRARDEENMG